MPTRKAKTKMIADVPPFLTAPQVAAMLNLDPVTIQRRVKSGKYPGAYKPGGKKTTAILIPSALFPVEQVRTYLREERDQSAN